MVNIHVEQVKGRAGVGWGRETVEKLRKQMHVGYSCTYQYCSCGDPP